MLYLVHVFEEYNFDIEDQNSYNIFTQDYARQYVENLIGKELSDKFFNGETFNIDADDDSEDNVSINFNGELLSVSDGEDIYRVLPMEMNSFFKSALGLRVPIS